MHSNKVEELKQTLKTQKENERPASAPTEKGNFPPSSSGSSSASSLEKEVQVLEEKLGQAQKEVAESKDRYIRLYAEFENFRKRAQREKEEFTRFAAEQVIKDLLPILDDLERALSHAEKSQEIKGLIEGMRLVEKQWTTSLEKAGLTPFSSLGQPFDPHMHEAMAQIETDQQAPGTVVQEYRKGYRIHDRLIRPALVAVAKEKSNSNR